MSDPHYRADVAYRGKTPDDDDWWALCGALCEAGDVVDSPSSVACLDCIALLIEDGYTFTDDG